MCEILFRGKRVYNGESIEGSAVRFDDDKLFIMPEHTNASTMTYAEIFCVTGAIVCPFSVGQYTGLTDKNGKKIFEKDIVEHHAQGDILVNRGVVEWDERNGRWGLRLNTMFPGFDLYSPEAYEVIGNIFDNPELLKEGEENE